MRYLRTLRRKPHGLTIRVGDLEKSLHFYTQALGFEITSRQDYEKDRFSLVFLRSPDDRESKGAQLELTHNWDTKKYERGDAYGHVAYQVDSIDAVQKRLKSAGYDLSWGPGMTPSGKTRMAFIDDPDGYEIELLEYR